MRLQSLFLLGALAACGADPAALKMAAAQKAIENNPASPDPYVALAAELCRKARDSGALAGPNPPATRAGTTWARDKENAKLRARAERAERELARTKAALDIVGKAHALLEMLSESADTETRSKP